MPYRFPPGGHGSLEHLQLFRQRPLHVIDRIVTTHFQFVGGHVQTLLRRSGGRDMRRPLPDEREISVSST